MNTKKRKSSARKRKSSASAAVRVGAKGDRAREALKLAAREVFNERGYAPARVQDITARAGFSLGAFYRYFMDKDGVLAELLDQFFADSYATTFHDSRYDPASPARSVYKSIHQTLCFIAQNSDVLKILWETSQTYETIEQRWNTLRSQLNERVTRAITRAKQDGIVFRELDLDSTSELLIGMIENAAYRGIVRGGKKSEAELADLALRLTFIWAHALFLPEALTDFAQLQSGAETHSEGSEERGADAVPIVGAD